MKLFTKARRERIERATKEVGQNVYSPKRAIVIAIACLFLIAGFIGIFIPLVPGFLLMTPGLILLSIYSPTIYTWLRVRTRKHPWVQGAIKKGRTVSIRIIHPKWLKRRKK